MTTYLVTCKSGPPLTIKAPDPDVAIYRAQRLGFAAIKAVPR